VIGILPVPLFQIGLHILRTTLYCLGRFPS